MNRRAVAAWALYDFGNSAFTTLVVTFVYAAFFTKLMAGNEIEGTAIWSRGVTATAVLVALLSPILGAVADRGGLRKVFLFVCTAICVVATTLLFWPEPGGENALAAITLFVIGNVAFELGGVFYNAFLPEIAPPEKVGRVSGYGWALGYVGGLLCLVVAFVGFVFPEEPWFGLSREAEENVRATNLLVAVWFAVFATPLFLFVREERREKIGIRVVGDSVRQLAGTFRALGPYRQVVRLLVARLVYNDGLVTIFAFGGIYAGVTMGFEFEDIIIFGIVLNITAGLGAFAMGFLDDRIGGKKTLFITLGGLAVGTLIAMVAPNAETFWVAGVIVGIFAGPNQAASRSLLARFVPEDKQNEFFGFFAFSGKATAFMGPLLFGLLTEWLGTQRAGIASVLAFFAIGAVLLGRIDEEEGIRLAQSSSKA